MLKWRMERIANPNFENNFEHHFRERDMQAAVGTRMKNKAIEKLSWTMEKEVKGIKFEF